MALRRAFKLVARERGVQSTLLVGPERYRAGMTMDASAALSNRAASTAISPNQPRGQAASFATSASAARFAGKHGAWRRKHAELSRLFAPCNATAIGANSRDKSVQDCESWCRPQLKPRHCHRCKCHACSGCEAKDAAARPNEASPATYSPLDAAGATPAQPGDLCLGVWHDDPLDGAPLVYRPCDGSWQQRQQQRWALEKQSPQASYYVRSVSDPRLCVTAHPIYDGSP